MGELRRGFDMTDTMFNDFVQQVDSRFYRHLFTRTNIPIKASKSREDFLGELQKKIATKEYHPQTPRAYIVLGKQHLVSRIIPVLKLADACVYYYCIKKIEDSLVKTRVDGTYGAFRMGGVMRKVEDADFARISEQESASPYPYNPLAWVKEWGDFQSKIVTYLGEDEYKYFIKFDISNFYDCINLAYLEARLRSACADEQMDLIDLLMYFLRFWNRDFENFKQKNIGIPQDEVGDCSRILANFYLHEYDKYLKEEAEKRGCKYVRYSDDQIIFAKDEAHAKEVLYLASNYLARINLNLNPSKVDIFDSLESFRNYWSIDIFEYLTEPFDQKRIETAIKIYIKRRDKGIHFRRSSVLRKITNVLSKSGIRIDLNLRKKIEDEITQEQHVLSSKGYDLKSIYAVLDGKSRRDFVKQLMKFSKMYLFNQYHYALLASGIPFLSKREIRKSIRDFK